MRGVVVLDMGQRRGQRDKSEGQRGGIGWVLCQHWCLGGHIWRWRELGLVHVQTIANSIVYSNFADACAFEDVIAKNIHHCATSADWLVGSRV
jgi:hypothetical protein